MENIYSEPTVAKMNTPRRNTATCFQATIEGFLDKKLSGVLRSKTSRRLCSVQGSVFYQMKTSQGLNQMDVTDMTDVQVQGVKKVSSDTTGTQFEIMKKKSSLVFICPSKEECNNWVRALQTAMTIKDSQPSTSIFYHMPESEENQGMYSTIGQDSNTMTTDSSSASGNLTQDSVNDSYYSCGEYSSPQDSLENKAIEASCLEDIYSEIPGESSLHPATMESFKKQDSKTLEDDLQKKDKSVNENEKVDPETYTEYSEGYSSGSIAVDKQEESDCNSDPLNHEDTVVDMRNNLNTFSREKNDSSQINGDTSPIVSSDTEDELQELFTALDDRLSPVKDMEHNLSAEDKMPLCELKNFLLSNKLLYRASTHNMLSEDEDPISACRSYIVQLDDMI